MNKIVLHLGSNLGHRNKNLHKARVLLREIGQETKYSNTYETGAWGVTDQDNFLNMAVLMNTPLSPETALKKVLDIENKMGRQRVKKWGTRLIDIDIIFFNNIIVDFSNLQIPHPWLQERRFVLVPLNDIIPNWQHPILKQSVNQLLLNCTDEGWVRPVN